MGQNTLKLGGKKLGRENWKFYSKNGDLLSINNEHRAQWFLKRDLVEIIGDKEVKFKIDTKNVDVVDDEFLLNPIERKCVVCGEETGLQKHHVIPYMYRKYMPESYKSNNHHDVVIICYRHHYSYERNYANVLKGQLANENNIKTIEELCRENGSILKPHLLTLQKCKTLLNYGIKLPVDKLISLSDDIIGNTPMLMNYSFDILTEEELQLALEYHLKFIKSNDELSYVSKNHAKVIIEIYTEKNQLNDFVIMWRKSFVENMNPKYLPAGWDIYRKVNISK